MVGLLYLRTRFLLFIFIQYRESLVYKKPWLLKALKLLEATLGLPLETRDLGSEATQGYLRLPWAYLGPTSGT